jgi:hypothetical protein
MNPARMLGRYSLNSATTLSATAHLVTLVAQVLLVSLGACSDSESTGTESQEEKTVSDAGSQDKQEPKSELDAEARKREEPEVKVEEDENKGAAEDEAKSEGNGGGADFCGVLSIMQKDCQVCHGTTLAAGAPMSLVSYEDFMKPAVSDPKRKVYELVEERTHSEKNPMPPAGVLSDEKLAPLNDWLKAGQPQAKSTCEVDEWDKVVRSEPDETWPEDCEDIYTITAHDPEDPSKPYEIPPDSEVHPFIVMDAPWGDDEVQLLATRPITDNKAAVHHWILWEAKDRVNLTFWAPGATGDSFADDVGLYMPHGKDSLGLDMHYFNRGNDKPAYDRSGLEVCVTRKNLRPKMATLYGLFGNATIPPKQRVENSTSCTVTGEMHILGVNPHMHHRGVRGYLSLQRGGTGPVEVLHDGPFSFEEQTLKPIEDTLIKEGDVLTTKCTFVNEDDRMITFGEDTEDEMCINWVRYYPKGGFRCSRMMPDGGVDEDPGADPGTGNGGPFPTGEDQDADAGVEPPSN